ncbi:GNAT family N-acetyltransferase [Nonomuraea sp. KC401]|uniref:GNAT family N-acetyltransferase n=1 Tax=unclassified Nonomuraea TaxID=2593643 RepID=UPI0010FF34E4|nr:MULTISPECIES: GNAT family protein [unclassified Nonomuraea]NBE94536.1 GNAT family N-acetyltransferase [Nonomuraea sp. K271]TLF76388.1 GNAT family N-acetyltransferase [Nonomuraea sp. KC401]
MRGVLCKGERLGLRDVTEADVAALHAVYGDPAATQHMPFHPRDLPEVSALVLQAMEAACAEPRRLYLLAVVDAEHHDVIGVARLRIEAEHPHSAEIGFGLHPGQWGRGTGTDLVRLLLKFGFRQLGLHRIWGARSPANLPAQLAMLTAGMVEEGRIRHHVRTPHGWRDSIVHSALDDEWAERS